MMKCLNKIKISNYTYLFILLCFLCGYIKNILIIFFICIIHEIGHIIFIKLYNYKIISINILPFGGYTLIDKKLNENINNELLIAFGGILIQLLMIFIVYLLKNNINNITYNLLIKYNLILIIFNLIPIIPLDGSNIINLLLDKFLPYNLSYKLNIIISIINIIIFLIINYFFNIDNYFIFSLLIYKIYEKIKDYKYYKNRFILERYLYNFKYKKIDYNIKNINSLKKETFHFFKNNNRYISEKNYIKMNLYK